VGGIQAHRGQARIGTLEAGTLNHTKGGEVRAGSTSHAGDAPVWPNVRVCPLSPRLSDSGGVKARSVPDSVEKRGCAGKFCDAIVL
jgi:hypothetical protein